MVKVAKEIDEPYDIDLPTADCQARTPSEKGRVTRRGKLWPRRWSKRHREACLDVENEAFQEKDGYMDEPRSVKDGAEDTNERVMTSHSEMCDQSGEGCKVTSVEEGHDVEFETYAKESQEAKINGVTQAIALLVKGMMIVVILKQVKDEMSADLTAFKKKGLDRKTNHQDLTKIETEEIFF